MSFAKTMVLPQSWRYYSLRCFAQFVSSFPSFHSPFNLHQALGKSAPQDWQLCAMLCKMLWNYFDDVANMEDPVCDEILLLLRSLVGAFQRHIALP
jgi:hypothetical protein